MSGSFRNQGFTMIELLVAVAITAVLAAIMLGVTMGTLDVWSRTQDRFTTDAQATLLLDFIERDFEASIFRSDGGAWLAVDVINNPATLANHGWITAGFTKPASSESARYVPAAIGGTVPSIKDARFGLSGTWLRFITTNVESGASLPVAVSYQIARRPVSGSVALSNPATIRYSLFRSAVSSSATFTTGYNVLSGYASSGATPPAQRSAGTVTNPNTSGDAIATNVVDFGVWLYRPDASGAMVRIYPVDGSDTTHVASALDEFPLAADVMLRVLTNEGARLIEEIETGNGRIQRPASYSTDAEWWWATVEANSRVYIRRIHRTNAGT